MNWKRLVNALLIVLVILSYTHVTHAAGNSGNTVYDSIQNQHQAQKTDQTKATDTTTKETLPNTSAGGTFVTFLKLFLALGVVLALIYVFYRFLSKRTKAFQQVGQIRNLGGVSVGTNRSVQLVKVGNDVLVLGIGENVTLLKEVDDQSIIESFSQAPESLSIRPNINRLMEWAKNTKKDKDDATSQPKSKFSLELNQLLKDREKGIDELLKKETPPHD